MRDRADDSTQRATTPFRLSSPDGGRFARALCAPVERALGLTALEQIYERAAGRAAAPFLDEALTTMDVDVRIAEHDLEGVPATGPVVVVANHPYGGIEGMILGRALRHCRPDVKIIANYFLGKMPELRELFLLVDPFETRDAVRRNLGPLRRALRWVAEGHLLVVFPAGEVAHLDPARRTVLDPPWNPMIAGIVRRTQATVVPVFFPGRNSALFQALGLIHPRMRTVMLGRELLRRRGTTVEARLGSAIPHKHLAGHGATDDELIAYLRGRTYILAERSSSPARQRAVQPRVTPKAVRPIVAAAPASTLAREIAGLPPEQRLVDSRDGEIWVAEAGQIPEVLREIGRLREITFREVGEGTGREIDLDEFDSSYRHLFIWNRDAAEIVGAYRLGLTDRLLAGRGLRGLYTSTLFDFKPSLFQSMGPALEMGRSFIRPDHQKSFTGLMLLWKGIGHYVVRNPGYATLFGPVSISADYRSASQQLIVAFLQQNKYAHDWSRWVRPHEPHRADRRSTIHQSLAQIKNLDDVSSFIAEIESDHKGVPILLKQYLKLGGRLLGFNVDPDFSNVLDVLIMVDLRQTAKKILARYMGREGVESFMAAHEASRAS